MNDFRRMMRPYKQGHLDGLCGIYSIVNAIRIIKGLNEDQCTEIYKEILTYLNKKKILIPTVIEGLNVNTLGSIFRYVIKDRLKRQVPFKRRKKVGIDEFWNFMVNYLNTDEKRVILLGLEGHYEHWTLVTNITEKRMCLFDSSDLTYLDRIRCTTSESTTKKRKHRLAPTITYFLS